MKTFIKTFFVIILAALAVIGCDEPPQAIPVQVRLNKELISNLPVGSTQTLIATLTPKDADVTVVWSSEDESIAVVNEDGEVTGVAPGTVVITAAVDQETATCKVVVTSVKPKSIKIVPSTVYLEKDEVRELEVVAEPAGAVLENLTWKSDNPKVVSVDAGKLTALDLGEAKVTVECLGEDGKCAAVCDVTVVEDGANAPSEVSEIKLLYNTMKLAEGEERELVWTVLPENAADKSVTIVSDNEECVTVSPEGLVKAIKTGTATVTVTANDGSGVSSSCVVTVIDASEAEPKVESVTISSVGGAMDVEVGLQLQLKAEVYPADLNPQMSWIISDDNNELDYASIDQNGLVTGLAAKRVNVNVGDMVKQDWASVVVTVYADGVSSSMTLKVIPRQPDDILFDLPEEGYIRVGQSWNFNPRVLPEGLGYQVYCFATLPDGKSQNSAYDDFTPSTAGAITALFAVSSSEDLVHDNIRKNVTLPVIPYYVETVTLPESMNIEAGSSFALTPEFTSDVEGHQPTYKDVKWASSDPSVATVDEKTGEITAIAEGETNITVTTTNSWAVPSGQEQKSATCVLTVMAPSTALNVGDYFYSDGTWSADLQSDKTVVGVVFARVNAAATDPVLGKDFPGCTHGLVLGLTEYSEQDFGSVSCYEGHGYYEGVGYNASSIVDDKKPNGYGNSKAHKDLNASKPDYVTLFNAESGVIATQTSAIATPSGASSWYVPSYKEMSMILASYDTINDSLDAAGGQKIAEPYENEESFDENRTSDWYWTSTIYGLAYGPSFDHYKYAYDISRGAWTASQQSFAKCKVRVVFAF